MSEPFSQTKNTLATRMGTVPRSREIAAIAVFAANALALYPLKFPAPYLPFLIYELWEIPIITAFLLYGPRIGTAVAAINFVSLLAIFPGQLPTGPFYNLLAILAMMFGVLLAYGLMSQRVRGNWILGLVVSMGVSMRVIVMTLVNSLLLPMPYPLGFNIPPDAVIAILPPIAFFNASIAVYTIPIAFIISAAVSSATRIPARYRQ